MMAKQKLNLNDEGKVQKSNKDKQHKFIVPNKLTKHFNWLEFT